MAARSRSCATIRCRRPRTSAVDVAPYCNGLAEAASELRRQLLDRLRAGELDAGRDSCMGAMDEIYSLLVTIDYPDGVTGGLRRTTDALRAVLERTRGDLTTAMVAARLQGAIESRRDAARTPGDRAERFGSLAVPSGV